jgi:hypothetical protein
VFWKYWPWNGEVLVRQGMITQGLQNIHAGLAAVQRIGVPTSLWDSTLFGRSYQMLAWHRRR